MRDQKRGYMTPGEVAERLMVSPITVRQWAQKGWLKAELTAGGHRRFRVEEVARFAKQRGMSFKPPGNENLRILLVDDDRQLAELLREVLTGLGDHIEVRQAHDGYDAGVQTQDFKPDIMLLDLMMPGLDGYSVCKLIKQNSETQAIRVIAMTGYYSDENVQRILHAGAETCLAKPFSPSDLLEAIAASPKP